MIKIDNSKSYLFNDNYKPCKLYSDGNLIQGWTEKEYSGNPIGISGTYNDLLDITCYGRHTQKNGFYADFRQMIVNGDFKEVNPWIINNSNCKFSIGDNTARVDYTTIKPYDIFILQQTNNKFDLSHKFYCSFLSRVVTSAANPYISVFSTGASTSVLFQTVTSKTNFIKKSFVGYFTNKNTTADRICIGLLGNLRDYQLYDYFEIKNFMMIDLTEMFGVGNEPSNASEFESLFPNAYYEYTDNPYRVFVGGKVSKIQIPYPDDPQEIIPVKPSINVIGESMYGTPQEIITDYELYGSDGVYDTLEPCVMVDGEWKCRVTRKWKLIEPNEYGKSPYPITNWGSLGAGVINNPSIKKSGAKLLCTHLPNIDKLDIYYGRTIGIAQNTNYNQIVFFINGFTQSSDYVEFFTKESVYMLYQLTDYSVELYPPIIINGMPYGTIINGNTDMLVKAKVMD